MTHTQETFTCRLCDGVLSHRFNLNVLQKYNVRYFECEECHSLQTENPYWLEEAYKNNNLSNLDTGAAQRNIHNLAACYSISKLFNVKNAIDIGGGDGLLCRLLRDYDINCYVKDKYKTPTYAQGFTEQDFTTPDLVIAFEVFEHYRNPQTDLIDLFQYDSRVILVSTVLYKKERQDWWYLAPESGQHVFFYSKQAVELIARKYDYQTVISGGFILFLKKENFSTAKRVLGGVLLNSVICRLMRGFILLLPAPGVWKDHFLQVEKSKFSGRVQNQDQNYSNRNTRKG